MWWVSLGIGLAAVVVLSACGESSSKTASPASAVQHQTARQIKTYILAVNKANEPFSHPPTGRITHAQVERLLRTAIAELSALTPPQVFAASYGRLLSGFRGELSATSDIERAERTHDAIAERNAEANAARSQAAVRAGLAETAAELKQCKQDNFTC
jgi:hypothetical protein